MFRVTVCASLIFSVALVGLCQAEFQVNTYTERNQTHPAVAMNASGQFVVAWRSCSMDGRGGGVYARYFASDGTPIGDEFKVNTSQVDVDNWTPAVGMDANGNFVVAWVAIQDNNCDVMGRLFDAQGAATTDEFKINESTTNTGQSMPAIAMSRDGKFVVVWTDWSAGCYAGRSRVLGRSFDADGAAVSGEFVVGEDECADWPDIGMDDSGRFVVTWIRKGDTYSRPYGQYIMFRRYEADGTPVGAAVQITKDLNITWYGPSVAVDSSGEFAIAWVVGPYPYDIVAQHFTTEGDIVTEPCMINTSFQGNHGHPRIAGDGQGRYLIIWDSQNSGDAYSDVIGHRCGPAGETLEPEFQINTSAQDRQWYADVAGGPGNMYVVVWISENQDGSGYGIFGELVTR